MTRERRQLGLRMPARLAGRRRALRCRLCEERESRAGVWALAAAPGDPAVTASEDGQYMPGGQHSQASICSF